MGFNDMSRKPDPVDVDEIWFADGPRRVRNVLACILTESFWKVFQCVMDPQTVRSLLVTNLPLTHLTS